MEINKNDPEILQALKIMGITDPEQINAIFKLAESVPDTIGTDILEKMHEAVNNPSAETLKERSKLIAKKEYDGMQRIKKTTWLN